MPPNQALQVIGLIYALVLFPLIAVLWYKKAFSRMTGMILLVLTTILGFVLFAPMAPYQFQLAVLGRQQGGSMPVAGVFAVLGVIWLMTLAFGRVFCGHLCPIGTVQELVYLVPVKKFILKHKRLTLAFRWVVFVLFITAALLFSVGIVLLFGIHDFFHLDWTSLLFWVFAVFLLVGVSVYRPFCRLFCPYGALLSVAARWSIFRFKNTDRCIDCLKCIRACPTGEAGSAAKKDECYMCGRCIEACGDTGGIEYRK